MPRCPPTQALAQQTRQLESRMVPWPVYEKLINAWVEGDDAKAVNATNKEMVPRLMDIFKVADEEDLGICPKFDVMQKVNALTAECQDVQRLSRALSRIDGVLVEYDVYKDAVDTWVRSSAP